MALSGTHVPLGRWGAEEMYEVLPFDRIGSFLYGLQKKRKERIRPVGLVKVQIAEDGERDNPLWYHQVSGNGVTHQVW